LAASIGIRIKRDSQTGGRRRQEQMSQIRERLRKAIDEQRHAAPPRPTASSDAATEAAFRPVRDAAAELRDELSHVPGLKITIVPDGVWIELYDRHFWLGYDVNNGEFIGTEQDTKWMEGGLRETPHRWDSAEACVEAMIQACARYVALAEAIGKLHSRG
jgi:hypothetical protein